MNSEPHIRRLAADLPPTPMEPQQELATILTNPAVRRVPHHLGEFRYPDSGLGAVGGSGPLGTSRAPGREAAFNVE